MGYRKRSFWEWVQHLAKALTARSSFSDTDTNDIKEFSPENRRTLVRTIVQYELDYIIQDGKRQ